MQCRLITVSNFLRIWVTPTAPTTRIERTASATKYLLLAFPLSCSKFAHYIQSTALGLCSHGSHSTAQVADSGADGCFDISAFATTEFLGPPGATRPRAFTRIRVSGRVVPSSEVPSSWQVCVCASDGYGNRHTS
jgi:hypothetical protein